MPHQPSGQGDPGGAGQRGEDPPGGHPPGRARHLAGHGGRDHQQGDPGRLHQDEAAVGRHAVHQPHGAAEVRPVVVLGEPKQVARPAQLPQPQRQACGGGRGDDPDHRVPAGGGEPAAGGHAARALVLRCPCGPDHPCPTSARPLTPSVRQMVIERARSVVDLAGVGADLLRPVTERPYVVVATTTTNAGGLAGACRDG